MQTQGGHASAQQSQHTLSFAQTGRTLFPQARAASLQGQAAPNSNAGAVSYEPSAKGGSGFPHLSAPR